MLLGHNLLHLCWLSTLVFHALKYKQIHHSRQGKQLLTEFEMIARAFLQRKNLFPPLSFIRELACILRDTGGRVLSQESPFARRGHQDHFTSLHKIWPISDDFYFCFCSNRWFWTYLFRQGISLWERFSPQEISRGGASRWGRPTKLLWSGTPKTQAHKDFGSGDPPPPLYIAFNGEAFTKLKGAP